MVAIEVVRRYGKDDVVLLNHDIIESSEDEDIKRFKQRVADYLELPITFANMPDWNKKDQFDVVIEAGAFKVKNGTALCSNRMKTRPFEEYLTVHFPDKNAIIYYGFDANEKARMQRRSSHLALRGFRTDYPVALWDRTIQSTREVGIEPPNVYSVFRHANCKGCLKAGKQHWYVVYCTAPEIWAKAKVAEEKIWYTILKDTSLEELEPMFEKMKSMGIPANEHLDGRTFWAQVKKQLQVEVSLENEMPCECII